MCRKLFWDESVDDDEKRGRCIIVGAGDFFGMPFQPAEEDYVIAADAGYENLKAAGIVPDLVVGDFDSMEVEGVKGVTGPVKDLDIFEDAEKAEYIHHLKRIELDDAIRADETFSILMGEKVEPRKEFIERNAKYAVNLDY